METTILRAVAVGAMALALAGGVQAATYSLAWEGSAGYSMTGNFSFDDSLLGGLITGSDLDELTISVFLHGELLGTRSLSDGLNEDEAEGFNFNFDAAAGTFLTGGESISATGQRWFVLNQVCPPVGFASGAFSQAVCVDGEGSFGFIDVGESTLTATRLLDPQPEPPAVIPLPATLPLLAAGLFGMVLLGRRRQGWRARPCVCALPR